MLRTKHASPHVTHPSRRSKRAALALLHAADGRASAETSAIAIWCGTVAAPASDAIVSDRAKVIETCFAGPEPERLLITIDEERLMEPTFWTAFSTIFMWRILSARVGSETTQPTTCVAGGERRARDGSAVACGANAQQRGGDARPGCSCGDRLLWARARPRLVPARTRAVVSMVSKKTPTRDPKKTDHETPSAEPASSPSWGAAVPTGTEPPCWRSATHPARKPPVLSQSASRAASEAPEGPWTMRLFEARAGGPQPRKKGFMLQSTVVVGRESALYAARDAFESAPETDRLARPATPPLHVPSEILTKLPAADGLTNSWAGMPAAGAGSACSWQHGPAARPVA